MMREKNNATRGLLFAGLGLICLGLGTAANAAGPKFKAVYRDENFHTNWNDAPVADAVTAYFKAQGYEVLDEPKLRPWLDARIKDHERAVLVNAHDTFPDSALDPVGADLLPSPNNPQRKFLLTGGRLLSFGDIPYYIHATDASRNDKGWSNVGGKVILGRGAASGTWGKAVPAKLTDAGKAWGLTLEINSIRAEQATDTDIVLSTDADGQAGSWIQKFTNAPGRGEFVRIYDFDPSEADITPEFLADMKRVAEYDPKGTVDGPLTSGFEGTATVAGKPLDSANLIVTDEAGKLVAYTASDTAGKFFAYPVPGTYKITYLHPIFGSISAPGSTVKVEAGKVASLGTLDFNPPVALGIASLKSADLAAAKLPGWAFLQTSNDDKATLGEPGAPNKDVLAKFCDAKLNTTGKDAVFANSTWFKDWTVVPGASEPSKAPSDAESIPDNTWFALSLKYKVTGDLAKGKSFRIMDFNIDDFYTQMCVNGVKVDGSNDGCWDCARSSIIPEGVMKTDGSENVITIVGYEGGGGAGFNKPELGGPNLYAYAGAAAPTVVKGDVNGDGKVDLKDATIALGIAVGSRARDAKSDAGGDVNADGKYDLKDATLILGAAVGIRTL